MAADAARWVRTRTGFDRVMVDRSDAEWNGQVIAEARQAPSVPDVTAALRAARSTCSTWP